MNASTNARGVFSTSRRIRSGNKIAFNLAEPISTAAVAARRILFAADYALPADGVNKSYYQSRVFKQCARCRACLESRDGTIFINGLL